MEFLILDSAPLPSQQRNTATICRDIKITIKQKYRPSRSSSHYPDTRQSTQITNKLKIRPGPPLAALQLLVCNVGLLQVSKPSSPGGRGPTVYNRQPGRIIWLESRGRNDQHQPAVPGTAEYGRWAGVTFVRILTQRQLDHLHTFYPSSPSFVGRLSRRRDATLECGLNTHIIISLIIITITITLVSQSRLRA